MIKKLIKSRDFVALRNVQDLSLKLRKSQDEKWTFLHQAVLDGDVEMADFLLSNGADVNAQDESFNTPIFLACSAKSLNLVRLLIDHGASVDLPDKYGNTPLWRSVYDYRRGGVLEIIDLLKSNGANPDYKNKSGNSPRDVAQRIANHPLVDYFSSWRPIDS